MKISAVVSAAAAAAVLSAVTAFADVGDVNGDTGITTTDVVLAAAHVKGERALVGDALADADVNGDGAVNASDVAAIAAHVKGIRSLDGYEAPTIVLTPDEPESPELPEQPAEPESPELPEQPAEPEGPVIEERDGVTYVNGILIANKTYALPENYGNGLTDEALSAFYEMQAGAANDGISLWICSGFRSYWDQYYLYWNYVDRDGRAEADRYSARPGHSEHQTGLAMDLNNASRTFNGSAEAEWIAAHCAEYGFIVRYPADKEDITGFMYESWHVRYVGKELAREITDSGLCLEEYLGIDSHYAD